MMQEAQGLSPQEAAIGERKIVTILFADLVNSTGIVTSLDPEDANTTLLNALHAACENIRRYRGTVLQIMGDGVLAAFGTPVALEDHAVRAGLAAQDIHAGLGARGRHLPMRVGLSSGQIVAYGSPGGIYPFIRVIGEPVHFAARMQERARPGRTILSQATRTFMGAHAKTERAGRYQLAGGRSSDIYELKNVQATLAADTEKTALRLGRLTGMVGRELELRMLQDNLETARAEAGKSILITGEAGIGKSRLVQEFVAASAQKAVPEFRCDFQPAEIAQPIRSFRRLVSRLIRPQDSLAPAGSDPLDAAAMAAFLGEEGHDRADWRNLEPAQKLDISVRAVTAAIIEASLDRVFIIICEDIHWADTIAGRTIRRLSRHIAASRILLLCTARSTMPASTIPFTATIRLGPLNEQATAKLVDKHLGDDPSLDELKDTLVRKTQGNPYYVEECVAALAESGALTDAPGGRYLLRQPVAGFIIPGSLRGALAARIDQLEVTDRNMLLHAAAVGRTFDTSLLEVITNSSSGTVAVHLNRLQELGLIKQSQLSPTIEYTFTHNLIQEVAYDTLLRHHRKRLHLAILAALSKQNANLLPAKVELMAEHAYRAEEWALAHVYCKRAAARAQAVSRNIEAKGYLFRALYAAEALGPTPRNLRRLAATQLELVPSLFALGEHEVARDHLTESLTAARQLGDRNLEAKISSNVALLHWITGNYAHAVRADRDALRLARQSRDGDQQIASTIRMGMLFCEAGNYIAAETFLRRGLKLIPANRADEKFGLLGTAAVGARTYLARTYAELGHFQSATDLGDESIELAAACADPFSQAFASIFTGIVLTRQGEYQRAHRVVQSGVALSQRAKLRLLLPLGQACLGYVAWRLGQDREAARNLIERAARSAAKQKMAARNSLILSWLAETQANDGEPGSARRQGDNALRLARANRERGQEAWARWTLGKITTNGPAEDSRSSITHFLEARKIATRRGMRPLQAHCELGMSRSLQRMGENARAVSCAATAKNIYKELGLPALADQAERRLTSLARRNPTNTRSYSAATS